MQHSYLSTILTTYYLFVTITIHVSRKMFSRGLGVAVFLVSLTLYFFFSSLIMVLFLGVYVPVYYAYMFLAGRNTRRGHIEY